MRKALVIASFGTSYEEVLRKNIEAIEDAVRSALPEYDFYRAFTSRFIVEKLNKRGYEVAIEKDVVEKLIKEGYEEILVQPTHIIPGFEYEKKILELAKLSPSVKVGEPLLFTPSDDEELVHALEGFYKFNEVDGAFVFMAHGTEHPANEHYKRFERLASGRNSNVYTAGVEGEHSFDELLDQLVAQGERDVTLAPLMVVAGDHVLNDMVGEEEDSWKSLSEAHGLKVDARLVGLGSIRAVQEMYVKKALALKDKA